jgi:tetratricopeptide (TPR) repeat protein
VLLAAGEGFRSFERLFEAEELATRLGDQARIAIVATRIAAHLWLAGQTEQTREYGRRALELAETLGDPGIAIASHYTMATAAMYWGEFPRVEAHAQRMLELLDGDHARARGDGLMFPSVGARGLLASARAQQGRFAAALQIGEEAVRIAESLRHPYGVAHVIAHLAFVHYQRGSHAEGLALCERGLALGEEATLGVMLPFLHGLLGHGRIQAGDVGTGVAALRDAIATQSAMGFRIGLSQLAGWLSEGLLLKGRLDEAITEAQRGMTLAMDCNERRVQATLEQVLGDLAAHRDPPSLDPAEAHYRRGLAIATELGAQPVIAHCHRGLGVLHRRIGDGDQARRHLTAATAMYREMAMTFWLEKAETELVN